MDTAEINEFRKIYDRIKSLSLVLADSHHLYLDNSERSRTIRVHFHMAQKSLGGALEEILAAERTAKDSAGVGSTFGRTRS